MRRLREKDEDALRELMARYGDELLRTAVLLLKDRQAAEEAVQDAFVQAFASIGQLRDPGKLRSWLLRIAVNRCRMRMRTWSWRRLLPSERAEELAEQAADDGPGPEPLLLARWRSARLSDAVGRLDYKYREVVTLYYYNELSVAEIAEQLDVNVNTVKARLARGRRALRRMLEEEGGPEWNGNGSG